MLILVLSLGNFVIGMGVFVAIGLILPIQETFGLTESQSGFILTIYAITYAISSPLLIAVTGAQSRKRVMLFGLGVFALSAIMIAFAQSAAILFLARALSALGAGLVTPVTASVAASITAPERQGKALATVFAGLTFAQVLGVPAGTWIGYTFGWQTAFWLVAGLGLLCMGGIARYVPRDLPFQVTNLHSLRDALRNWRGLLIIGFTTSFLGAIYVVFTNLPPLVEQTMGYGRDGITALLILFGVGAVLGNYLGGWMADRIGPLKTLKMLCIAQVILMPAYSLLPMSDWMLAVLMILWAVFGWSFMAGQQVRVVRMSGNRPAVSLALNAAAVYLGATIGSSIGAATISTLSVNALGVVGSATALLALGHLLLSERVVRNG
ncbi:Predicted arabinose efflux permease, MFS family [Monaibacterium marinum]|uniref:Predicted arabinose efflux permease, MFS family n=1 Tax=Pontivivens marinum TaxID=1690039 RepID=A0A2C9CTA3_9RHOB|nr:MFS transporter [Monaibacterium marinum]SOH94731.1 Predicted arabinose efflux permease, MFS family [Monaibacterium marinum]